MPQKINSIHFEILVFVENTEMSRWLYTLEIHPMWKRLNQWSKGVLL